MMNFDQSRFVNFVMLNHKIKHMKQKDTRPTEEELVTRSGNEDVNEPQTTTESSKEEIRPFKRKKWDPSRQEEE